MTEEFFFLRPLTDQRLPLGQRVLPSSTPAIYTAPPRIGLVISTYGAAPHIDLALALRGRLYPDVPVLVHDDASGHGEKLDAVCRKHGVDLEVNSSRLGHEMGDLSGIVGGLRWARERGVELLVKMSRRFVPLLNWTSGLSDLAMTRQFGTFGRGCQRWRLPLRTECFAMHVGHWTCPEVLDELSTFMLTNQLSIWVEHYVHGMAGRVHAMRCQANRAWEDQNVRITPRPSIGEWDFVPPSRQERTAGQLWPEAGASAADYASVARQVGLNYPPEAFSGLWSQAGA